MYNDTHEIYLKFLKHFILEVKTSFPKIFYDKMNLQSILMTFLYEVNTYVNYDISEEIVFIICIIIYIF